MKLNSVRIQKTLSIPEFHPYKDQSYGIDKFKSNYFQKQSTKRFSYNKDDSQKKCIAKNYFFPFKNRFRNYEKVFKDKFLTTRIESMSKVKKQIRIPKFIREKQLSKSEQISSFKNKIQRTYKKIKEVQFNRKINTQKEIQTFNEKQLDYLQNQQSFQVFQTHNPKFNQNLLEDNYNSKNSLYQLKNNVYKPNELKSTRSSIKISSKKFADNRFFVPKLSLKEQKQIEQDLFDLFSSRYDSSNNKDIDMDYEDEQLTKQFMSILN